MSYANNVQVILASAVGVGDTSITFHDAVTPLNNPPSDGAVTLVDDLKSPTKIEIIDYTSVTSNGNGTSTLTGVTRGLEDTVAQSFTVGAIYQSLTAGQVEAIAPTIGVTQLIKMGIK